LLQDLEPARNYIPDDKLLTKISEEMRKALQGHEESSIFEEITSEDEKGEATLPSVKRAVREAFLKIIEEINAANEY
jgi:hypothetical protein